MIASGPRFPTRPSPTWFSPNRPGQHGKTVAVQGSTSFRRWLFAQRGLLLFLSPRCKNTGLPGGSGGRCQAEFQLPSLMQSSPPPSGASSHSMPLAFVLLDLHHWPLSPWRSWRRLSPSPTGALGERPDGGGGRKGRDGRPGQLLSQLRWSLSLPSPLPTKQGSPRPTTVRLVTVHS